MEKRGGVGVVKRFLFMLARLKHLVRSLSANQDVSGYFNVLSSPYLPGTP